MHRIPDSSGLYPIPPDPNLVRWQISGLFWDLNLTCLPNSVSSDITVIPWNQPLGEYWHHEVSRCYKLRHVCVCACMCVCVCVWSSLPAHHSTHYWLPPLETEWQASHPPALSSNCVRIMHSTHLSSLVNPSRAFIICQAELSLWTFLLQRGTNHQSQPLTTFSGHVLVRRPGISSHLPAPSSNPQLPGSFTQLSPPEFSTPDVS